MAGSSGIFRAVHLIVSGTLHGLLMDQSSSLPGRRRSALASRLAESGTMVVACFFGLVICGWWAVGRIAPGELIWPLNPNLLAAAIFVGAFASVLLVARLVGVRLSGRATRGGFDALLGAVFLPSLTACVLLRVAVQAAAFVGTTPVATAVEFTVVSPHIIRSSPALTLRYGEFGRSFTIPVSRAIYDAASSGETVTLPVETGRFGIQRAVAATRLTIEDLHRPH